MRPQSLLPIPLTLPSKQSQAPYGPHLGFDIAARDKTVMHALYLIPAPERVKNEGANEHTLSHLDHRTPCGGDP
ncbi:MAG: hypothetical protein JWO08_1697 [Verrucomicrobiaceae bacterium]|nr:hypothetical protein [Verrucomicrobiaceae bacterium]